MILCNLVEFVNRPMVSPTITDSVRLVEEFVKITDNGKVRHNTFISIKIYKPRDKTKSLEEFPLSVWIIPRRYSVAKGS